MEKIISCCGLNCAVCEARIATINDNDELRKATADKWKVYYNVPELSPSLINCTGCREEGPKIGHWNSCQIRICAAGKGFKTCGECEGMTTCNLVAALHKNVPEAVTNLKDLN